MNTQNVKTATRESSERWGSDRRARLACAIAEQKSSTHGGRGCRLQQRRNIMTSHKTPFSFDVWEKSALTSGTR